MVFGTNFKLVVTSEESLSYSGESSSSRWWRRTQFNSSHDCVCKVLWSASAQIKYSCVTFEEMFWHWNGWKWCKWVCENVKLHFSVFGLFVLLLFFFQFWCFPYCFYCTIYRFCIFWRVDRDWRLFSVADWLWRQKLPVLPLKNLGLNNVIK